MLKFKSGLHQKAFAFFSPAFQIIKRWFLFVDISQKTDILCLFLLLFCSFLVRLLAILCSDDCKLSPLFLSSLQQQQQQNTNGYAPLNENEVATHCILGYYTILSMAYCSRIPNMASDRCL